MRTKSGTTKWAFIDSSTLTYIITRHTTGWGYFAMQGDKPCFCYGTLPCVMYVCFFCWFVFCGFLVFFSFDFAHLLWLSSFVYRCKAFKHSGKLSWWNQNLWLWSQWAVDRLHGKLLRRYPILHGGELMRKLCMSITSNSYFHFILSSYTFSSPSLIICDSRCYFLPW